MSVKNIMIEIEGLIKNTVISCASLYGFSVLEALAKIDSNGNLVKAVVDKELKAAEKLRAKEALVKQKEAEKEAEKQQKEALVEQKKAEKLRLKESLEAERSSMKEEELLSKAAEKQALKEQKKALKEAEKALVKQQKKEKKVVVIDEPCVESPSKEDDDCFVRFQNIPLMNEINSIRDVKKFKNYKKLSAGVKLARQMMDI